jgi:hypothetical protein
VVALALGADVVEVAAKEKVSVAAGPVARQDQTHVMGARKVWAVTPATTMARLAIGPRIVIQKQRKGRPTIMVEVTEAVGSMAQQARTRVMGERKVWAMTPVTIVARLTIGQRIVIQKQRKGRPIRPLMMSPPFC